MLDDNNTKGRIRFSLDFGPLRRLFRKGVKPRTLLITALALFLVIATVYAAISYPTLFRPTGSQQNQPGQFGPGNTDRTYVPAAGANSPAAPVSTGNAAPPSADAAEQPQPNATDSTAEPAADDASQQSQPALTAPTTLAWPVRGKTVTGFGIARSVTLGDWRQHDGLDIQAAQGVSVTAAAAGTVTAAEKRNDTGYTVVIDHGGGVTTVYGCLLVSGRKVGDQVKAGDEVGKVGNSGMSEVALDCHLHFEVRRDGAAVDPTDWMK